MKTSKETEVTSSSIAYVQRQFFEGKQPTSPVEVKNEELKIDTFVTDPAKVSVAMGLTLNLGNYESARLDVSVTVPCYREETDDAYTYARKWVEKRLGEEVASLRKHKPDIF